MKNEMERPNLGSDNELIQFIIRMAQKCSETQDEYERKYYLKEIEFAIKALQVK